MQPTSVFHGPIDGRIVIPGTHTATGGTTHFNIGCQSSHDRHAQPREPFSTVPFAPDADFVDRPEILAWVRDKCLGPGARAALVGLGGVGKSQLAIQYAHRVRDAALPTCVFWVHASTRARFEQAYRGLADRLDLPGRLDPKADVLRLVSNWLCDETNGKWTMVVDNDDVETFFPSRRLDRHGTVESSSASLAAYLPQSRNGSILVTSRNRDAAARLAGGYHNIREVFAMDESQGLQLLRNKLPAVSHEEGAAVDMLRTLDCMPLAITQAAAYINRRARMTIAGYLDEFRANDKQRESLLNQDAGDLRRDDSASNSVVTTWQMSFKRIQQERPSAAELLSLMSFFNPQGIPEKTLRRHNRTAARAGALDDEGEADRMFTEDLDTLHAYSLVTMTRTTAADNELWEMHALVQFCTQVWLSSFREAERWKREFIELMAREFPSGQFENWMQCQQLLPHIEPLYDTKPDSEQSSKAWARVLTNTAWYLWMKGSYQTAQAVATKAVTARERVLGLSNNQTLASITVLALVLQYQGKYEDAEKLNRRALEGSEKELGAHHPDTLTSVSNLALVLQYQGKYDEAEKLNRQALEGSEKELGAHHPDTLTSLSNLACVLRYQGKYDEAEKLNWRALERREKELGAHHPDTLTSVSNLALVLQDQGKYDEAEKLNRRALEGSEKELGAYHPDTLTSVYCLAYILHTIKRYAEAAQLYQRAYDGHVQKLGPQHPQTIACGNHFSALQEEARQTALAESRDLDQCGKDAIVNTTCAERTFAQAGSRQKDKQDSFLARIKQKMRRSDR
ncbi:TPR-like protein [Lentithecium fluviatile CBS 122367]|uniref:TPR-like protein n=1 Tax=Lentithecium fluviatile CBS 122367 TaxID=1168545 RepID=A0A6G1IHM8_9PLEO|nr:TPR-like protein [Lentithecium fluviatile CBS 122367]